MSSEAFTSEEIRAISQQLAAIEMPPPPNWWPLLIGVSLLLVVLLAVAIMLYLRHCKSRHAKTNALEKERALLQLEQLYQAWNSNQIDDNRAAYRLATLLRLGLGLQQLDEIPPAPLNNETSQWQQLLKQLHQLRYAPRQTNTLTAGSFDLVRRWLNTEVTC